MKKEELQKQMGKLEEALEELRSGINSKKRNLIRVLGMISGRGLYPSFNENKQESSWFEIFTEIGRLLQVKRNVELEEFTHSIEQRVLELEKKKEKK